MEPIQIKPVSEQLVESIREHMGHTELVEEIGVDQHGHRWTRYHKRFVFDLPDKKPEASDDAEHKK